jgi:DNA-binding transcriptional ArsR family regulator
VSGPGSTAERAAGWAELDPLLTAPKRLAAMAVLSRAGSVDFGFLREHLGVSDSDLSKQMAALQGAGYVAVAKSGRGRGATTRYRITGDGRAAYQRHRQVLQSLLE